MATAKDKLDFVRHVLDNTNLHNSLRMSALDAISEIEAELAGEPPPSNKPAKSGYYWHRRDPSESWRIFLVASAGNGLPVGEWRFIEYPVEPKQEAS